MHLYAAVRSVIFDMAIALLGVLAYCQSKSRRSLSLKQKLGPISITSARCVAWRCVSLRTIVSDS